ncbi:MAG: response regulator transcription factor [Nocardioides sp.]
MGNTLPSHRLWCTSHLTGDPGLCARRFTARKGCAVWVIEPHPGAAPIIQVDADAVDHLDADDARALASAAVQAAEVVEEATSAATRGSALTPQEVAVLRLVLEGSSTAGIAARLSLAPGTVRNYLASASVKLDTSSRHQAARDARRRGLI